MVISLEQQCGGADSVSVHFKPAPRVPRYNPEEPYQITLLDPPKACENHPEIVRRKKNTEVYGECLGCHAKVDENSVAYVAMIGRHHHEKGTGASDGRISVFRIYQRADYNKTG